MDKFLTRPASDIPRTKKRPHDSQETVDNTQATKASGKKKKKVSSAPISAAQIQKHYKTWKPVFPWLLLEDGRMGCECCFMFPALAGNKSAFACRNAGSTNFHVTVRLCLDFEFELSLSCTLFIHLVPAKTREE